MKELKAPKFVSNKVATIFLAGSIEMGVAEQWQERVVAMFAGTPWTILNPRRDDWDNSWKQSMEDERFVEQVQWELQGLEDCEHAIVYFSPDTKAPITLLELGLLSQLAPEKTIVVCPDGFYRKGNVSVVCDRYRLRMCNTLEDAANLIKTGDSGIDF